MLSRPKPILTAAAFCLALAGPGLAQQTPAPQQTPVQEVKPQAQVVYDQLLKHYAEARTYHSTPIFSRTSPDGAWTDIRRGAFELALDRPNRRLLLTHPDWRLVVRDGKLYFRIVGRNSHHVEADLPGRITLGKLFTHIEMVANPLLVDAALLLSDQSPLEQFTGSQSATFAYDAEASQLRIASPQGQLTLDLDGNLVEHALLSGPQGPVTLGYQMTNARINEPLDASLFEFDTTGSQAVAGMQQLIPALRRAAASGDSQQPQAMPEQAMNMELPLLDGGTIKLADVEEKLIVLEFWAAWCGPCRISLPWTAKVARSVNEQGLDVKILALNVEDTEDVVREFAQNNGLEGLPIPMDLDGVFARSVGVSTFPLTMFIRDGQLVHTQRGVIPDEQTFAEHMQEQIRELLGESGGSADSEGPGGE